MAQPVQTLTYEDRPVIDRAHLRQMTAGARELERELLQLFDTQCAVLIDRMAQCEAPARAALAHTLKGSALGIGALRVAEMAAALEHAGEGHTPALAELQRAVMQARAAIAHMLACAAK